MLCLFEGIDDHVAIQAYTYLEHKTKMEADYETRRGPYWTGLHKETQQTLKVNKKKIGLRC